MVLRITLLVSFSSLIFPVNASALVSVKPKPQCSIVNNLTGDPVGVYNPLLPKTSVVVGELPANTSITCSNLKRFTIFKGRKRATRVARRDWRNPTQYTISVNLTPGSYTIGTSVPPVKTVRPNSNAVPFTVTDASVSVPVVTPTPSPQTPKTVGAAPALAAFPLWEQTMKSLGKQYCNQQNLQQLSTWEGSIWYYDGIKVYQQIADYTKDSSWLQCADYVKSIYRPYVLGANGKVGGWKFSPQGLLRDWQRTGDPQSKAAVIQLATNSPFAQQSGGVDPELSRETAYLIHAYRAAAAVGAPQAALLTKAVNNALTHLAAWRTGNTTYVKPFMMALTMEALIGYAEETGDSRVLPAVQASADWLYTNLWDAKRNAFPYIMCRFPTASTECSSPDNAASADLNLLIVPVYGWLYHKTGDAKYLTQGDGIFNGGVTQAWLGNGKQFSQNYRWSFDYLKWRQG